MTAQRLGLICKILAQNRLRDVKLVGKSAFEKELNNWFNQPPIDISWSTTDVNNTNSPIPPRYEDIYLNKIAA